MILHYFKYLERPSRYYLIYVVLAGISLFMTFNLPYRFEEASYTLMVYEMWHHHEFLPPRLTA